MLVDVGLRRPIAITRTGTGPADFMVLGTECNHLNCGVDRAGDGFKCPCHGSTYTFEGTLISGPASANLPQYAFSVEGDVMTIHAE